MIRSRHALLAVLLALIGHDLASACSCVRAEPWVPAPPAFVARVLYVDRVGEHNVAYTLVERAWGTSALGLVTIRTFGDGSSCSERFPPPGGRYVVFGDAKLDEPVGVVNCSPNGPLEQYRADIEALGAPTWEREIDATLVERHTAEALVRATAERSCESFEATVPAWIGDGDTSFIGAIDAIVERNEPWRDRSAGYRWIPPRDDVPHAELRVDLHNPFTCWLEICADMKRDREPIDARVPGQPRCTRARPLSYYRHSTFFDVEPATGARFALDLRFRLVETGPVVETR
ncbi:MAG: hypothetical protein AAGE94_07905 [Acidobacteriota bacterium]